VRTYERGVEDETYACGTGVTASAIAFHKLFKKTSFNTGYAAVSSSAESIVRVQTLKDILQVKFTFKGDDNYTGIKLTGPATYVFSCEVQI
jgi:diaminopimelate epimerase